MATQKRSRTGCWTCREAGYKCDEARPHCGRCTRLKITCKGYGVRLKWQGIALTTPSNPPQKSRTKRITSDEEQSSVLPSLYTLSTSSVVHRIPSDLMLLPASTLNLPLVRVQTLQPAPDLPAKDQFLLYYWTEHLSSLISVASTKHHATPFQTHLTAMIYESVALRSTVLSMAANHWARASNDPVFKIQSYQHQRIAIRELQNMIQAPHKFSYEPALATVLMMQVSARLFGDEDDMAVANHLLGARAIIAQHQEDKRHATSSERFLLNLFAYHDILTSISRGAQPLLDHTASFAAVEGDETLRKIATVLLIVAQTSKLQSTIRNRRLHSDDVGLMEEEDSTGRQIQELLLAMDLDCPASEETHEDTDVKFTTQAYLHSAFIYLYRTWLEIGAPNPISMDHIHRCLEFLARVDVHSPLASAHIWPLFTAGCEAIDAAERQFVRQRFAEMYAVKHFPSLKRVMRDIEDIWAAKDVEQQMKGQDGMAKVDCIQVILRRRGREVDLA